MIRYTYNSGTNKQDDAFNYDLVGNILNILSSKTACGIGGTNQLDRQFSYDPLYRLTSATGRENVPGSSYPFPGWEDFTRSTDPNTSTAYTRKYKYDKLGNIQQLQHIGNTNFIRDFSYTANTNKLDEINIGANSYNYTYDACGNQLTTNTERKFEWDAANKLLCFRNQVGSAEPSVIAQYLYDSAGNRTKKIVRKQGGIFEIRNYIDGVFEFFTDETNVQNTIHIMDSLSRELGNQSRIATVRLGYNFDDSTPPIKYVLENNIGSSMVLLDDAGAPVNTQEYYPFGETSFGSYAKKRYQYTGKERDEESGLYYYGARYYSAWTCRFISIDPLASKYPNLSGYLYAYNNPIMMNDPTGMEGEEGGGSADNIDGGNAVGGKITENTNSIDSLTEPENVSNEIDTNGTSSKLVFKSDIAKEIHESKSTPVYKTNKDGSVKTRKGEPVLKKGTGYSEEYVNLINEIESKATGKIQISEASKVFGNEAGSVVAAIDNDGNPTGDLVVYFSKPNEVHGGTEEHVLLEELFHVKQILDSKSWQENLVEPKITPQMEVEAKSFAAKHGGPFEKYYLNSSYEFPTEMLIMSGGDINNQINPLKYLTEKVSLISNKRTPDEKPITIDHYPLYKK